jgi:2OG-Fe(II) oxygenase superfamily
MACRISSCSPAAFSRTGNPVGFIQKRGMHKMIPLQPGLLLIKNGLSLSEQITLTEIAMKLGEDPDKGFWKIDQLGQKVLNQAPSSPHRGRIFDALERFPSVCNELCQSNLVRASEIDSSIHPIRATHLILLYYKTLAESPIGGYIPWHQDKDPNDGDQDKPVVSFTIGDSCEFLVCNDKPQISQTHTLSNPKNLAHRVLLESGDVLIFGGSSRKIHHSIFKMHRNTAPNSLPLQGARLNFTFRYAPKISGKEEKFLSKHFKSVYHKGPDSPEKVQVDLGPSFDSHRPTIIFIITDPTINRTKGPSAPTEGPFSFLFRKEQNPKRAHGVKGHV